MPRPTRTQYVTEQRLKETIDALRRELGLRVSAVQTTVQNFNTSPAVIVPARGTTNTNVKSWGKTAGISGAFSADDHVHVFNPTVRFVEASGDLTCNGTFADVPGLSLQVTPTGDAEALVIASLDVDILTAGEFEARILLNAIAEDGIMEGDTASVAARLPHCKAWRVTNILANNTATIKVQARDPTAAGSVVHQTNSSLYALFFAG